MEALGDSLLLFVMVNIKCLHSQDTLPDVRIHNCILLTIPAVYGVLP